MNRDEIIELTGAANWDQAVEWFNGMTAEEILDYCNEIWPTLDNEELAAAIVEELS